jgi:hypothetical protein
MRKIYFFEPFIFIIVLQISFEIISVFLFLLREVTSIQSISSIPSFICSLDHPFFSARVIYWIDIFSKSVKSVPGLKFKDFPKVSVVLSNKELSIHQILIFDLGNGVSEVIIRLFVLFIVVHSHKIDSGSVFSLSLLLKSVSWIHENSIMLVA